MRCASTLQLFCFSLRIKLTMRSYHQNYQRHQTHGLASATKKTITPECAQNMKFVKPSHDDYPDSQEVGEIKRSSFDPRLPEHCVEINQHHLYALLTDVQKFVPNTDLQQFWCDSANSRYSQPVVDDISLWNHVLFSHKPGTVKCMSKLLILP